MNLQNVTYSGFVGVWSNEPVIIIVDYWNCVHGDSVVVTDVQQVKIV